ncbi:unnamed protein product [Blepharisma stoltei]|uniref:AAA+ ATPase domain-containing protein n=1 Tax=Blepharisma stoltei TaxID=1481888 RepID=A0AAU9IN36_9CILI|nr:unnamed protein product [Blepharisma stoltei]
MLSRRVWRLLASGHRPPFRAFADDKPPKGFEKFYKKKKDPESDEKQETQEKPKEEPKEESKKEEKADKEEKNTYKSSSEKLKWSFEDMKSGFNKNPNNWRNLGILAAASLGYALLQYHPDDGVPLITFQELIQKYIETNALKKIKIEISKSKDLSVLHDVYLINHYEDKVGKLRIPDINSFLASLHAEQIALGRDKKDLIPVEYEEKGQPMAESVTSIVSPSTIFTLAALLLLYNVVKKSKGGNSGSNGGWGDIFGMTKASFKVYGIDKKIDVKFKDVAGLQEAKKEIMEFVEFLKNPKKFKKLGARIPRGALLVGPPGTGKTLLAKAAAGEAGVPFFSISGSDFVEMFVGVGASRVRQLFKQARERAPSIIFIDEIDAVGKKRHGKMGGNDERDNTLNQLLVEMDGFSTDSHVVVMAGTNRKDILDSALLRPGRFDRTIELTLPDIEGREDILKVHLQPLKLNPELKTEDYARRIAALTPGFSGADLANLCNEAAIVAARANKESVDKADFETASERVIGGLEKTKKLSGREKSIVAHHESGHAVAGWFLEGADPVLKVSILPRSKGALGFAQFLPNETMLYSKEELIDKICATLGGRVAEEIFFGKVTTGAQDDLSKATQIAQAIVSSFGMTEKLGVVGYNYEQESFSKPFSEDTNRIIDEEVRTVIDHCLQKTRDLLLSKKDLIGKLAGALMDKERVTHSDLVEVLGERPFETKGEYKRFIEEGKKIESENQH